MLSPQCLYLFSNHTVSEILIQNKRYSCRVCFTYPDLISNQRFLTFALVSLFSKPLYFYRPQRSCGQGNIFTPVCHSVHRGGLPQCMLGYPPTGSRHPPESRTPWEQNPPLEQNPHLGADPPEQTPPPGSRPP